MGYVEPGELVTLALMLIAVGVTVAIAERIPRWQAFSLGIVWISLQLCAHVLTVIETPSSPAVVNLAEHAFLMVAAVTALIALVLHKRSARGERE